MTDPIADFLTRIRNAVKANHKVVEAPGSKIKQAITKILFEQGYILNYKFVEGDNTPQGTIKIAGYKDMPRVLNGLGVAILSTSQGVMTNKQAADLKIGGEVLCYVY